MTRRESLARFPDQLHQIGHTALGQVLEVEHHPAVAGSVRGYGVAVRRVPPACPMCRSEAWVPTVWRPFATQLEPVEAR